jgi:hypothetical protein
VIGVGEANYWAHAGGVVFKTDDRDLFLPLEPDNLVRAWAACEALDFELWLGNEPPDKPRDKWLADRIVAQRALTRATAPDGTQVDLTLVMKGFEFETVWAERRVFLVDGVEIPAARLLHIVTSKQAAARPKDQLFLTTHKDALEQLLKPPKQ